MPVISIHEIMDSIAKHIEDENYLEALRGAHMLCERLLRLATEGKE